MGRLRTLVPGGECSDGHSLTGDNIAPVGKTGRIKCKACKAAYQKSVREENWRIRMSERPACVVHIDENGSSRFYVGADARMLVIDEREPEDRVHEVRSTISYEMMEKLIGKSPIVGKGFRSRKLNNVQASE